MSLEYSFRFSQSPTSLEYIYIYIYYINAHIFLSIWQVYALMEDLVDNMCDLLDEPNEGDEQDTHF